MTNTPVVASEVSPAPVVIGEMPDDVSTVFTVKVAATLVSAAVIVAALYFGRDILIPLAFAFLIGFALSPAVTRLRRLGLPKIVSVGLVVTSLLLFLAGLVLVLGVQVRSLSEQLPTYQTTIRAKLSDLRTQLKAPGFLDGAMRTVDVVQKEVETPQDPATAPQRVEVVPPPGSQVENALIWLGRTVEPLATVGIVLIFVVLALLDRTDLRDRLLRILGGNLHRSTDALEEAGKRISKYLLMQFVVNVSYGVPLALGLWLIGVPGALLWGVVAAVMRFIPYLGPMVSAVFPLALAFAVDPGWHMVLWALAIILGLELISNNVVEPLLYGSSTGLSAISLIAAATFWTALWGPVGLILSTPLTVCLLVIGKNLPQLQFLDTLLGSMPALSPATRVYQRLLANDVEEAIDIADGEIEKSSVVAFYDTIGIDVLRLARADYGRLATAEHRLRVASGMDELLSELREEHPASPANHPKVVCIGGKWEIDTIAAEMLAHALELDGIVAAAVPMVDATTRSIGKLELDDVSVVCLSYFSHEPESAARQFCRRLRRRWSNIRIILVVWSRPAQILASETYRELGADEVAASITEVIGRTRRMLPQLGNEPERAAIPSNDKERLAALHGTRILNQALREDLDAIAKRAADAFDADVALITVIDHDREIVIGQNRVVPGLDRDELDRAVLPREAAIGGYIVAAGESLLVSDTERDPRFSDNPVVKALRQRFCAGAPLRAPDGFVLGAFSILDAEPRTMDQREMGLLEKLADDVMESIGETDGGKKADVDNETPGEASAIIGQQIPE